VFITDITHYLAIWFWIGWTFVYATVFFWLPLLYLYQRALLTAIIGLMTLSLFYPINRKLQPKWGYAIAEVAMKKALEYFQLRMILEDPEAIEKCGVSIFAMEPHNVLPLSIFSFNDCLNGIPGHKCLGCITSLCFSIPLMKHVYTW
jgi:hypothetical protein